MILANPPFGLSNETVDKIRDVFARHPEVSQAILYGSRAMGTQRDGSDIDHTLTGGDLNLKFLARIETELDDLLRPLQFDLSIYPECRGTLPIEATPPVHPVPRGPTP